MELITPSHAWAFFVLTFIADSKICFKAFQKIPYAGLFRLLDHPDIAVVNRASISINNILVGGSQSTPDAQPHPHFKAVSTIGGIDKLYSLYKKNPTSSIKDKAALCIGQLFRGKEIPDPSMRKDIIAFHKEASNSPDEHLRDAATRGLRFLAQNAGMNYKFIHIID